jgi:hypothetical protein
VSSFSCLIIMVSIFFNITSLATFTCRWSVQIKIEMFGYTTIEYWLQELLIFLFVIIMHVPLPFAFSHRRAHTFCCTAWILENCSGLAVIWSTSFFILFLWPDSHWHRGSSAQSHVVCKIAHLRNLAYLVLIHNKALKGAYQSIILVALWVHTGGSFHYINSRISSRELTFLHSIPG